ncbi:MAG: MYXO-CTERM sorting domain-containing protein [Byssovorax sp.]
MLRRSSLVPALVTLAALAAATTAQPAEACEPPLPGLTGTIPASGNIYPSNAPVFFQGYDLSLANVTVSVSDIQQPYKLIPTSLPGSLGLSAMVDPLPPSGHTVTIEGNFCSDPAQCQPMALSYMVGNPDLTAPGGAMPVSFNVYDYVDYKSSGGDCTSDSDLAYWVELKSVVPDPNGSPEIYTLEVYHDEGLQDQVETFSGFIPPEGHAVVQIRAFASQLGGKSPPEAFCFHVKTADAAGNPAPENTESPLVICKPCYARTSTDPNMGFGPPPEPMWTSEDIYAGGPCDSGQSSGVGGNYPDGGLSHGTGGSTSTSGATTGGDDAQVIGGCGCRVAGEETQIPALLGGLGLLAMRGLRRRRRM